MKLKQYAEKINKLAEKYPDFVVVYAIDDEGNEYHEVLCEPVIGRFHGDIFENIYSKFIEDPITEENSNSCCIN